MRDLSAADIEGAWVDPGYRTGLIERCKENWNVPFSKLSDLMLATLRYAQ